MKLATDLRSHGIDASIDQWDLSPGQDIAAFMERGVSNSDRVLMVCSDAYVEKSDTGLGGVGYERLIVTGELVANIDTKKFLPIIRNNFGLHKTPKFLGPRLYIDFTRDVEYQSKLEDLLRELHGTPAVVKRCPSHAVVHLLMTHWCLLATMAGVGRLANPCVLESIRNTRTFQKNAAILILLQHPG